MHEPIRATFVTIDADGTETKLPALVDPESGSIELQDGTVVHDSNREYYVLHEEEYFLVEVHPSQIRLYPEDLGEFRAVVMD